MSLKACARSGLARRPGWRGRHSKLTENLPVWRAKVQRDLTDRANDFEPTNCCATLITKIVLSIR